MSLLFLRIDKNPREKRYHSLNHRLKDKCDDGKNCLLQKILQNFFLKDYKILFFETKPCVFFLCRSMIIILHAAI